MRTSLRLALAAPLLGLVAACGGQSSASGDPYERGLEQAKAGDHAAAVASFDAALKGRSSDDELYLEIQMARVEAMTHTNPADATIEFLALADADPDAVTPNDYMRVFNWLTAVKSYDQGGKLATALKEAHPGSTELAAQMDTRIEEAIAAGEVDQSMLEALQGLGYLGD